MNVTALITGFEPYGGCSLNPSGQLAKALNGTEIAGLAVEGRVLPVVLAEIGGRVEAALGEVEPDLVIALGLSPGEPILRLERFGVNLADFTIPDNAGTHSVDAALVPDGATALAATLPLRAIERALLEAGIPARLSNSAGTYLCNAALYGLLSALKRRGRSVPCGFIHLPYLPVQVAELLSEERAGRINLAQRADLASMEFATLERAVRIALAVTAADLQRPAEPH